jgi:hypothetical protein
MLNMWACFVASSDMGEKKVITMNVVDTHEFQQNSPKNTGLESRAGLHKFSKKI